MSKPKILWSSTSGDLRKEKEVNTDEVVGENLILHLKRLTAGKGRPVVEISNLPNNKKWNSDLTKTLKKRLGTGGALKSDYIEIHGEVIAKICEILDSKKIKWKKIGG